MDDRTRGVGRGGGRFNDEQCIGEEEMSRSTMQGRERICGRRENGMNLFSCN